MEIIKELTEYLENFVEKPHPCFNNLPICPFVRKARLDNEIWFHLGFQSTEIIEKIHEFIKQDKKKILWIINPDKNYSLKETYEFIDNIQSQVKELDVELFGGHPEDPFKIGDLYTRREPYPNFVVQSKKTLEEARNSLKKTNYYNKL